MDQAAGWLPDPERDGQERYWDGSHWTDHVRPAGKGVTIRLPDHVPELQRALAEATQDVESVEDRLSSLFDRRRGSAAAPTNGAESHVAGSNGTGPPASDPARHADAETGASDAGADDDYDVELYLDIEVDDDDPSLRDLDDEGEGAIGTGSADVIVLDEPDESLSALDAALAAEEPHEDKAGPPAKEKKSLFRRRS